MRRIRAGIIGLGFIGTAHLEALRRLGSVEVVAVADSDRRKVERLGVARIYENWQDLVGDPEVEVVHNCTPNRDHFPINRACLAAGKPVFSEKPLALDSRETAELSRLARETGLAAGVNFCYRYYPAVQWARHLVAAGHLGEIYAVHGRYLQDWLMFAADYNWRVEEDQGGRARALGDIGSHWCDLACYITGLAIGQVMADYATLIPVRRRPSLAADTFQQHAADTEPVRVSTDDWAAVLFRLGRDVRGSFIVSQISAGHKNGLEIEIDGSLRSLFWRQEDPEHLVIGERGGANHHLYKDPAAMPASVARFAHYPAGHGEGYADSLKNSINSFYAALDGQGPSDHPTFADGHRIMKVIEAIIQSGAERRWVEISYE